MPSGEWVSLSDSLSGLSVRKNKIAFYSNSQFNSDGICDYTIIDSVVFKNKEKTILGTYLKTKCLADTAYYKITNRDSATISLLLQDNKTESYQLKKK